jgi:hypothetical protein
MEVGEQVVSEAESWQKEQFSVAFLHALATRFGYTVAQWRPDKDGVDGTLRCCGLMVDLQLKCTSSPLTYSDGFKYVLDKKTYDKLRCADRSAPGYLALMVVPKDVQAWILHKPKHLLIACQAYWSCLQDMSDEASGDTKTIYLPSIQTLDGSALASMFAFSLEMVRRSA